MMLGPLEIPPLLQTDKKLYLIEITFMSWQSIHKNIKNAQYKGRLFIVQSKYENNVTAIIKIYRSKGHNFIENVSLFKY